MNIIKSIVRDVVIVAGLSSVVVFAQSWSGPTATPPENNTPAPINVSAVSQSKTGGLWVGSLGVSGGATIGGYVGIGVIPSSALHIKSPASATIFTGSTVTGQVTIDNTNGNGYYSGITFKGDQPNPIAKIGMLQTGGGSYLNFGTSNNYGAGVTNTALTISPLGNIGIGTANPISALDTFGTLSIGNVANAGLPGKVQIVTGGTSPVKNRLTYGTDGSGWKFAIGKNQSGTVTDQLIIQDNGYVGIGVIPSSALHIKSPASATIFTGSTVTGQVTIDNTNGNGYYSGITFKGDQPNPIAKIGMLQTGGGSYLNFGTSNNYGAGVTNTALTISPLGNIGIGTANPISALDTFGTLSIGNVANAGLPGKVQIVTGGTSPVKNRLTYGTDGSGWKFAIGKNQSGTVTDQLIIQDNGYVGIGTANPAEKLDVNGSLKAASLETGNYIYTPASADLVFSPGRTLERMRIMAGGKVGIGTNSPAGQLDIASSQGDVSNSAIRATYPGGGNLTGTEFGALAHRNVFGTGMWNAVYAKQGTSSSTNAIFAEGKVIVDGNVGIGTASPVQKLDVVGNVKGTGLCIGSDCRTSWPSGGGGGISGSGTSGNLTMWASTTSVGNYAGSNTCSVGQFVTQINSNGAVSCANPPTPVKGKVSCDYFTFQSWWQSPILSGEQLCATHPPLNYGYDTCVNTNGGPANCDTTPSSPLEWVSCCKIQ